MRTRTFLLVLTFGFVACGSSGIQSKDNGPVDYGCVSLPDASADGFTDGNTELQCLKNEDCDDHDPCTVDACNNNVSECVHKHMPDCHACKPYPGNPECDDGSPCTDDSCNEQGLCEYIPIEGCGVACQSDSDCNQLMDFVKCLDETHAKNHGPYGICGDKGYCLEADSTQSCGSANPCIKGHCDPKQGCVFEQIPGCKQ